MSETATLHGTIERIIFKNDQTGFAVGILHAEKQEITFKGCLPTAQAGQQVTLQGTWITHPKFGKQFDVQSSTATIPTTQLGLKKYLGSGMIKGIGPVYAEKIVNYFGLSSLEIIDIYPDRLNEISGIGPKRIERIVQGWQEQKEISGIMLFLQEKGISPAYATKIYKKFGNQAQQIVTENPYRLANEIWGIGFKIADRIAHHIGLSATSIKRIRSGILYLLSSATSAGHLYAIVDELKIQAIELLELNEQEHMPLITLALHELYNDKSIKLVSLDNQTHYIALTAHYATEKAVAQKIKKLLYYQCNHQFNLVEIKKKLSESQSSMVLNEDQQRAIITCLSQKITIITGGPGTGKTTLIKQLLSVLRSHKIRFKLAAPTGRAAKRITQSTGDEASTIHRLLEFDPTQMQFTRNEQNALSLDFLIIDEASMIDIFLAHALLKALPYGAHLILIGDQDQLPSVGAGNVLPDLIKSQIIPCVKLTYLFRQAHNSLITLNAHRVNAGDFFFNTKNIEISEIDINQIKRDFIFIKEESPEMVSNHLKKIITQELKKYNIPLQDAIVLVPMNRGMVGTQKLNEDLQAIINPGQKDQIAHIGINFKCDDRVMQIRNNYDKLVFNGDIGTIKNIDMNDQLITVDFDGHQVSYEIHELDELMLAYAISIHKSQGSEYAAAIIPLFMQHYTLLARNLLYTAITRAKKLCICIGQPKAFAIAIHNNKNKERHTLLSQFLTSDLSCR